MATKLVKDLKVGDVLSVKDPEGTAVITNKERSRLFEASGGCWRLDLRITGGPNKGKPITDQHHPGDMEVHLAEPTPA